MVGGGKVKPPSSCPLTGEIGIARRQKSGDELLKLYEAHFGLSLPTPIAAAYFRATFTEYEGTRSGLRWFDPPIAGGSELYEFLDRALSWYYSADTWDKRYALLMAEQLGSRSLFEAGCGGGELLRAAKSRGLHVFGSELNKSKVEELRRIGFTVFPAHSLPENCRADALVLIQVLEHIQRPLEFTHDLLARVHPRHLLIAVPASDTLLGRTSDPLVWPPHHISLWSHRALQTLARLLGAKLLSVAYDPLERTRFYHMVGHGLDEPIFGLPPPHRPRMLSAAYHVGRALRRSWALRAHTIFGVFEFDV